jgi:D-alanine-D-alanine ligase|nr:MAG: D-alanine--D-alanine ligase [Pseudomonadota bacterium]
MKRSRVLVVLHPSLMPPDSLEGQDPRAIEEWRTEFDVIQTLKASGHEVRALGVLDSITELRAIIDEWQPDVVFNLLEEFDGIVSYDQHVVAFLEMLRQPYTGCNPRGLLISRDKVLCKQVFAWHRIPSPQFQIYRRGQKVRIPRRQRYPLFVKSSTDDASLGISQASVVTDAAQLKERVEFMIEQHKSDVLVEEYIEGRELYVGVLGNQRITTFPVWELDFGSLANPIATRRLKWDPKYRARHGIDSAPAENLPEGTAAQLDRLSRRIYRALGLTGYARVDFRMRPDGSVYVLEANANPHLAREEDFARAAAAAGRDYPALLDSIVKLGLTYPAQWRVLYGT